MSELRSKPEVLKPNVKPESLTRMEKHLERPITHGFDRALNECLDDLENLKKKELCWLEECDSEPKTEEEKHAQS